MKIAILSTFYPFRGGIAQFNANLYQALKKNNEVFPFTFTRQYPDFLFPGKTQYVTEDDNAVIIESIPVLDTMNPFSYFSAAKRIAKMQPDVLVMKYWMSYLAPSLGMVAKRLNKNCKVITILDNVIPHEKHFFDIPFTRWFLKQNTGFIAMSESVQQDLFSLLPDAKCLLKPHPLYDHFGEKVSLERARRALELDPDKKTVLFFGLIRDYKGLDLLIDAFNFLNEDYQLLIAGESYGSFQKYEEQIQHTKHPDRIKVFNRYISDNEVPLFFSASDVCVLPYCSATQSGITSIAYYFEVPLLATNVGGLAESIVKPGVGMMIPEVTGKSIADSIMNFYAQKVTIDFTANFKKEKSLLSWDNFAEALINYASLL